MLIDLAHNFEIKKCVRKLLLLLRIKLWFYDRAWFCITSIHTRINYQTLRRDPFSRKRIRGRSCAERDATSIFGVDFVFREGGTDRGRANKGTWGRWKGSRHLACEITRATIALNTENCLRCLQASGHRPTFLWIVPRSWKSGGITRIPPVGAAVELGFLYAWWTRLENWEDNGVGENRGIRGWLDGRSF